MMLKCAKSINVRGKVKLKPFNAELNPICHLLTLLGAHHILHVGRIRVKNQPIRYVGGNGNITSSILRLSKEEWGVSSTLVTLPTMERDLAIYWKADEWDSKLIWTWCQWVFSNLFSFHEQHFRPNTQTKHTIPGHELRGCSWFSEEL